MLNRIQDNPFLIADKVISWEALAAFNPSVVKDNKIFHMLYRAMSFPEDIQDVHMSVSSIGYAISTDGIHYEKRKQLIKPEHGWEIFGCEDPRVTKLDDTYYIFYTALSAHPFDANAIKIGVALTKDFKTIEAKHPVTTFNSKAMALFPERINGKIVAVLTVHTDIPPAKIALALFDEEEQIWSTQYWNEWYASLNFNIIPLLRTSYDHLEVGAPPIKTQYGWLLIHSYIENYFSEDKKFGIEVALLDLNNPLKVIGRMKKPILMPKESYELLGNVPNVIFPSGALIENEYLYVYYGGADTNGCLAIGKLDEILKDLIVTKEIVFVASRVEDGFKRYNQNPIISPRPEFDWEAKATFNPAVIYEAGKFHIIYRAMSHSDTSVWGYASSFDGVTIDERSADPIYFPKEIFEKKLKRGNSGCEDPRITKLGDRFYVFYVAYDGFTPRVAFTSILISDFLKKWWNWERSKVISSPNIPDKDACLLSKKINNQYVIFHRIGNDIYLDSIDNLTFITDRWLLNKLPLIETNYGKIQKVGISTPPIETKYGWLLFYHWVSRDDIPHYKMGVALLELNNPTHVIKKDVLLLEPEMDYEKIGIIPNVVFPCGAVLLDSSVFLYYGAADRVIAVAKMELDDILKKLKVII